MSVKNIEKPALRAQRTWLHVHSINKEKQKIERQSVRDEGRGGGADNLRINNGQTAMIDGWKADKKRQRGQHVYQAPVCLSPGPRSQKKKNRLQGQREHYRREEEGMRGRARRGEERRGEEEEMINNGGGGICETHEASDDGAAVCETEEREVKEGGETETCWPLLNLWIKLSWTQDSHHMSADHLCACVCVFARGRAECVCGWLCVCLSVQLPVD